jgi:hypothetical protein
VAVALDLKISQFRNRSRTRQPPHRIEIYVDRMEQLFNSMDPSPFHEKDLDHDAEEFIVSWAQEYHLRDPLLLRIHVNQTPTEPDAADLVEKAVHNYFSYRANLSRLELKRLLKQGRISLVIGLLFLGGCLVLSDLLAQNEHGTLFNLARESLTIAGWVAMWSPMQTFLYDWWPLLYMRRLYEKLSDLPVEVIRRGDQRSEKRGQKTERD